MRSDLISVIEAAYRVTVPEEKWLEQILEACAPLLPLEMGIYGYLFDASGPSLKSSTWRSAPRSIETENAMRAMIEGVPREYVERTWLGNPFGHASDVAGSVEILERAGAPYRDVLAINGVDPSGRGVWIGGPLARVAASSRVEAERWTRVAAHLAAAYRVRRQLAHAEDPTVKAVAILDPAGKIAHAEVDAHSDDARKKLRAAAVAMDRARTASARAEPDAGLARWRGLVDAEWSLVDHFDHDGKHFVVARTNRPYVGALADLSQRELQTLALMALGHSTKIVAYELGLSVSTIRVLVMRAVRKLGVKTREEAIAMFRAYDE